MKIFYRFGNLSGDKQKSDPSNGEHNTANHRQNMVKKLRFFNLTHANFCYTQKSNQ